MKRLARTFGCPTELALELLSGKWKTVILARLKDGPLRYGELPACITRLSDKMLTQSPQGLHDRSLISRDVAPQPTARYRLTQAGRSLRPLLQQLHDWGGTQANRLGVVIVDRTEDAVDP